MEYMPYIWLGIAVFLAVVEVCTTQLVSLWFVIGASVTAICAATFLKGELLWQILLFLAASALMLVLTRPLVKKLKSAETVSTNYDRNIGKIATVISDIDPTSGVGQVRVGAEKWSAKADSSTVITVGTQVKVIGIEGVKLVVSTETE